MLWLQLVGALVDTPVANHICCSASPPDLRAHAAPHLTHAHHHHRHRTSASTQKAVSEGAAAANRYLDEIQAQAKEVLRTNAPPEQQAASWFSAALSGLDAFVSAGEEGGVLGQGCCECVWWWWWGRALSV
jgi:hypothetical protein